jgi:protocatechuate 3,4-dioxygenase beta subunit
LIALQNYDFCEVLGSLSGNVYHDRDNDGDRETNQNEEGIAGVVLQLLNEAGQPIRDSQGQPRTAITDSNGFYKFADLSPGIYRVTELQPAGWLDGLDTPGFVAFGTSQQRTVGQVTANDQLGHIALVQDDNEIGALHGVEYNFGELRSASIAGMVHSDINNNCIFEPELTFPQPQQREIALANVTIILRDSLGQVVRTTTTDEHGHYRFDDLKPGTYTIEELQPADYFDSLHHAGNLGGDDSTANRVINIKLLSGDEGVEYDFCEVPPATLSGYVFQDGDSVFSLDGRAPTQLDLVRDGLRTSDDTPLAGVWLELRNGLDGSPILGSDALPGHYGPGPLRVQTDANGFYQFTGLPRGNYAVYESHPNTYLDSIDTPGTTLGVAWNAHQSAPLGILVRMADNPPPRFDAILNIGLGAGQHSLENNFSEVRVVSIPLPPEVPRAPLTPIPPAQIIPQRPPALPPLGALPEAPLEWIYLAGSADVTWHLSIVDAGRPRGQREVSPTNGDRWANVRVNRNWNLNNLRSGRWLIGASTNAEQPIIEHNFGLVGATPLAGDFDGDGDAEVALYYKGEWYIDVNGNGQWDEGDLWARLGDERDLPVVGDWDGDGKDDIGIFGPIWAGDPRAIAYEPGLPDSKNLIQPPEDPKNVPPLAEHATDGMRVLQLTSEGLPRADLIDHVFQFGAVGDVAVSGDWDGESIDNIGVFRQGAWLIDMNGDGRLSPEDKTFSYGQAGDVPLVGDFNGDGVDEVGFYRAGQVTVDSNRNYQLDATDRVFQIVGSGRPVVADFNADGTDDVVTYEEMNSTSESIDLTESGGEQPAL